MTSTIDTKIRCGKISISNWYNNPMPKNGHQNQYPDEPERESSLNTQSRTMTVS